MSYHETLANGAFDSKMFHCVYALVKHQNKYHKNDLSMQVCTSSTELCQTGSVFL